VVPMFESPNLMAGTTQTLNKTCERARWSQFPQVLSALNSRHAWLISVRLRTARDDVAGGDDRGRRGGRLAGGPRVRACGWRYPAGSRLSAFPRERRQRRQMNRSRRTPLAPREEKRRVVGAVFTWC